MVSLATISARTADRAVDEVEVIEDSADASRPFVQGRRFFHKKEKKILPTKGRTTDE